MPLPIGKKKCRVLRASKPAHAPKAAKVMKGKKKGAGPAPLAGAAATTKKSKVHHNRHKKHQRKLKRHKAKVCGG